MASVNAEISPGLNKLLMLSISKSSHIRSEFTQCIDSIRDYARDNHHFKNRTGWLERNINSVLTSTYPLEGEVYVSNKLVHYAKYVHNGTKSSNKYITPVNRKSLRWSHGGAFIFAKKVRHKGIKSDPFLEYSLKETKEKVRQRLVRAIKTEMGL